MRVSFGHGFDVHPFAASERPLRLAGITVASIGGLDGHSDGDVACHAIADALLGAAAIGDLGSRFGVDEAATEGADSAVLLATVARDLQEAGWAIGNIDVTIVAQQPRLAPLRDAMREALAVACGLAPDAVSVKFTTTDQLGSIGRGEGIAAFATCSIATLPASRP